MLNSFFREKFPFAFNYFSNLIEFVKKEERFFPQGLIFEGEDTKTQLLFTLELARILNCKENDPNGECPNCKWIKSFSHPAINLVSQIHSKPDTDTSKTVISAKQAAEIENNLKISSDYYRFFIFFSSKETTYDSFELQNFSNLGYSAELDFSIEPLDYSTFGAATLNALLKSVEEPPKNTTFVFLTKSKENILPTIVSRCQVFKLSSSIDKLKFDDIKDLISFYPNVSSENFYDISENFLNYSKENNIEIETLLYKFLEYLKELLKSNNEEHFKILNDINIVNLAIKMLNSNINEKNTLETMFLKMARGY